MSQVQIYEVRFQVVKASPGGQAGAAYKYRNPIRLALVQAASMHPKDLLTVLNADVTLGSGESIEILGVTQLAGGTEGTSAVMT